MWIVGDGSVVGLVISGIVKDFPSGLQITMDCQSHLAQRKVAEEGRGTVRLSEGEGRGIVGYFQASAAVLRCDLRLEGTPVVWVRKQSLEKYT